MLMYQINEPGSNESQFWTPEHYNAFTVLAAQWQEALAKAVAVEVTAKRVNEKVLHNDIPSLPTVSGG
jgi:hypothetical protein